MRLLLPRLCLAALAACGPAAEVETPPSPPPPQVPASTILTVNGEPLDRAEAEDLTHAVESLYPEYSRQHARRLALTGELLPRLAGRALAPEAWRAAREACVAFDPELTPGQPLRTRGNFAALGLGLWNEGRKLAPGEWSPPVELFGRFVRLHLEDSAPADDPRAAELELSVLEFPYLDAVRARELLQEAIDRASLVILDPSWREAVPEAWQLRMRPDRP